MPFHKSNRQNKFRKNCFNRNCNKIRAAADPVVLLRPQSKRSSAPGNSCPRKRNLSSWQLQPQKKEAPAPGNSGTSKKEAQLRGNSSPGKKKLSSTQLRLRNTGFKEINSNDKTWTKCLFFSEQASACSFSIVALKLWALVYCFHYIFTHTHWG